MVIECGVCFEEYEEGTLELHLKTCVFRLVFQCTLCDEDYVSKEGLWIHLDLHEVADESKELYYQEIKAKYKLHHCSRCNVHRCFSETSYRIHFQTVHERIIKKKKRIPQCSIKALEPPKEKQKFPCDECGRLLSQRSSVLRHKISHHSKSKYPCLLCGKPFNSRKENKKHSVMCKAKKWLCNLCGTVFKWISSARAHTREKHPGTDNSKTIKLIRTGDRKYALRKRNGRNTTVITTVDKSDSPTNAPQDDSLEQEIQLKETQLQEQLSSDGESENMDSMDDEPLARLVEREKTESKILELRKESLVYDKIDDKAFPCLVCGRTYASPTSLRRHEVIYHTKPRLKCCFCQKMFHYPEQLRRHVKHCLAALGLPSDLKISKHSNGDKPEAEGPEDEEKTTTELRDGSKQPGRTTKSHPHDHRSKNGEELPEDAIEPELVDEQPKATTNGPKPLGRPRKSIIHDKAGNMLWSCLICKLTFKEKTALRHHIVTLHTEPSRQCSYCPKMLGHIDHVRLHEKRCIGKQCLTCGIRFTTRVLCNDHKIFHEKLPPDGKKKNMEQNKGGKPSFPCSICGRPNTSEKTVWRHKVVCHTEPQLKCSFCQASFFFRAEVERHGQLCSELRCHKCEILFASRNLLNIHNITKHSLEDDSMNIEAGDVEGTTQVEKQNPAESHDRVEQAESSPATTSITCLEKTKPHKNVSQGENIELELDVKVEDTVLQGQENHTSNGNADRSSSSTLVPRKNTEAELEAGREQMTPAKVRIRKPAPGIDQSIDEINRRIRRWMTREKISMPSSNAEVYVTVQDRTSIKCWHCSKIIALNSFSPKGTWNWNISYFTHHIMSHMPSSPLSSQAAGSETPKQNSV